MWERALTLRRFAPLPERARNLSHITSTSELIGQFRANLSQLTILRVHVIAEVEQKYLFFHSFFLLLATCPALQAEWIVVLHITVTRPRGIWGAESRSHQPCSCRSSVRGCDLESRKY